MDIDPDRFRELSKEEIVRELVNHVSTSEEEQNEKEHRSGSNTDLNIYILENRGYEIGSLDDQINHIIEDPTISDYAKNYVEDHTFSEEIVDEDVTVVQITTPEKSRVDDSTWIFHEGYIWVLTTERQEWRKTIENLIKYLPKVERLYLSPDYLEILTRRIRDSDISGFTAKYHAPHADRHATLRFHGGQLGDLEDVQKYFNAKPTRIEFDQANSPSVAIEAAGTNKGRFSVQSVVEGSQDKAIATLFEFSEGYQDLDEESFKVEYSSHLESSENGFTIDGFTAIELTDPDRDEDLNELLFEEVKNNVLNRTQYKYGERAENTLRVYDSRHEEFFDLAVEPPNIVIYPRRSTTSLSLREVVQNILEYDSTYSHEKVADAITAR